MDILELLLGKYWAQTAFVLGLLCGVLSYFIKRLFDFKSKKREINHTQFLNHRINAVNGFIVSYTKISREWDNLPIYDILMHKLTAGKIDNIMKTPKTEMKLSTESLVPYY